MQLRKFKLKDLKGLFPKSCAAEWQSRDTRRGGPDGPSLTWIRMSVPLWKAQGSSFLRELQHQASGVQYRVPQIPGQHPQGTLKFPKHPPPAQRAKDPKFPQRGVEKLDPGRPSDSQTLICRFSDPPGASSSSGPHERWSSAVALAHQTPHGIKGKSRRAKD